MKSIIGGAINMDSFINKDDITKDQFDKLVKSGKFDIYTPEAINAFNKEINNVLSKGETDSISSETLSEIEMQKDLIKGLAVVTVIGDDLKKAYFFIGESQVDIEKGIYKNTYFNRKHFLVGKEWHRKKKGVQDTEKDTVKTKSGNTVNEPTHEAPKESEKKKAKGGSHFELTSESIMHDGVKLFRVQYKDGTVGGFVEKKENLADNAKVLGNAKVYDNAVVSGNAEVYNNAWISGNARVSGKAKVHGNARVFGKAKVSGNAEVYSNAWISGNARVSDKALVFGTAFVSGDAEVSGDARVSGDTVVRGNAEVHGNARVSGKAKVHGNARVSDNAEVCGDAEVSGIAWVYGNAEVYDNAVVCDDAEVCVNAKVCGNAKVSGEALVFGNAVVSGDAKVFGKAGVYDNAVVCGKAKVSGDTVVCGNDRITSNDFKK